MGDGKSPLAALFRAVAEIIDEGPKGPVLLASKLCELAAHYMNEVPRSEAVITFAAAASALEAVHLCEKDRRFDNSVTDAGGPIPAVEPSRIRRRQRP